MTRFDKLFSVSKPIIGMVHLRPLPGSPLYDPINMDMKRILAIAKDEAKMLEDAGVDGVQVENMWDIPYLRARISAQKPLLRWQSAFMKYPTAFPFPPAPSAT